MPIYEYECPKCGRFDVLQKMSDPVLTTHEKCGSPVSKLMSASAFSFKGSGFYITDYARKSGSSPDTKAEKPKSEGCCKDCPSGGSGECKAA